MAKPPEETSTLADLHPDRLDQLTPREVLSAVNAALLTGARRSPSNDTREALIAVSTALVETFRD